MKIDDAITLADLTTAMMKMTAKSKGEKMDEGTSQLVYMIDALVEYAKKCRSQEIMKPAFTADKEGLN